MEATLLILELLLAISLIGNAVQAYRWSRYRSQPSGAHSHTGVLMAVSQEAVALDRKRMLAQRNK